MDHIDALLPSYIKWKCWECSTVHTKCHWGGTLHTFTILYHPQVWSTIPPWCEVWFNNESGWRMPDEPGKSHWWEHVVLLRIITQSCEYWGFFQIFFEFIEHIPFAQSSQLAQVSFLPRHRLVPCQWLSWWYFENLLLRVAVLRM